jgi:hypothetical protein
MEGDGNQKDSANHPRNEQQPQCHQSQTIPENCGQTDQCHRSRKSAYKEYPDALSHVRAFPRFDILHVPIPF